MEPGVKWESGKKIKLEIGVKVTSCWALKSSEGILPFS